MAYQVSDPLESKEPRRFPMWTDGPIGTTFCKLPIRVHLLSYQKTVPSFQLFQTPLVGIAYLVVAVQADGKR